MLTAYLEGENQMTELEHSLQVQPNADLMNSVLRLPPFQFSLGVEGRDDVLNAVAVGVAIVIVRHPGVTCETFLLLLRDDDKLTSVFFI